MKIQQAITESKIELAGDLKTLITKWKKQGVDITLFPSGIQKDYMTLSRIFMEKGDRRSGLGTKAMQDIIDLADDYQYKIGCTPTNEWGSGKARLIQFYRRFGFVKNKNYKYSETYIRKPEHE